MVLGFLWVCYVSTFFSDGIVIQTFVSFGSFPHFPVVLEFILFSFFWLGHVAFYWLCFLPLFQWLFLVPSAFSCNLFIFDSLFCLHASWKSFLVLSIAVFSDLISSLVTFFYFVLCYFLCASCLYHQHFYHLVSLFTGSWCYMLLVYNHTRWSRITTDFVWIVYLDNG